MIKDFAIKNRTSQVVPTKTAARIEEMLSLAGASNVSKHYDGGDLKGIDFVIPTEFGILSFRLPVNTEAAIKVLYDRKTRNGAISHKQRNALEEQAKRTAWKMAQDWLEIQLSMVVMQQAELVQVLLPYVVKGNQTLFDTMKSGGYRALLTAPEPKEPDFEEVE